MTEDARGPAACPACGLIMDGNSCLRGTDRWEIPTSEGWEETRARWEREPWNCHDCGVRPGGFHHLGCAVETCPCGKSQAIMCEHFEQRLQAPLS